MKLMSIWFIDHRTFASNLLQYIMYWYNNAVFSHFSGVVRVYVITFACIYTDQKWMKNLTFLTQTCFLGYTMAVCISQWRVSSLTYKVDYCVQECCVCVCIHEDYRIIWVPLNHAVKSMKTHWYYYIFSSTVDHRLALSYKIPVGAFTYQYKKFLQVWKKSTSDMKSAYHTMLYCYVIMLCYKIMWSCMIMWCCIIIQIQIKGDSTPAGWWRSTVSTTLQ